MENEQREPMQSESIAKLAEALSKAQGKIKGAAKDTNNTFFKAKYADLASVWDACREQLSAHGLSVFQTTDDGPEGVTVITTLAHSSGEWVRGRLTMKPVKSDPQGVGSAITYARRYALAAIVGVAPEDDDGNAASGRQGGPSNALVTSSQAADLEALADEVGADKAAFLKYVRAESFAAIPAGKYADALAALQKKRAA